MQTIETFTAIFFILLSAMGILAVLLTMGYMVYGEEEEEQSNGMLFPMKESIIRMAFDNIASHISNIDAIRVLVDDLGSKNLTTNAVIDALQNKIEDAEVTLRTDIRILINECRQLESRTKS